MARKKMTELDKATKRLEVILAKQFEAASAILREGDRIIIPEFMGYQDAADTIVQHMESMEEGIETLAEFECHPNDGLVALYTAMKNTFGELLGDATYTFFGKIPGRSIAVHTSYHETVTVPIGESSVPGLPISMKIYPEYDKDHELGGGFKVVFGYKRKYEPLVKRIEALTREELANNSIFRAKALNSNFKYMNIESFDTNSVIYTASEGRQIEANILSPIKETDSWLKNGNSLKRGILLYGPYGTGKTLTALATAKTCVENGWTFINVLPGDDIVRALSLARRYEPACVFFEDIDSTTGGARGVRVNEILNSIDGLLSKEHQVITVLTTNHIENINRAMLRPGRLDSVIQLGILDSETVIRMVMSVAGSNSIEGELDEQEIWEAADGYVPAFITESVTKAKAYAISRNGSQSGVLKINNDDIVSALQELRPQWDIMNSEQNVTTYTIDSAIEQAMQNVVKSKIVKYDDAIEKLEDNQCV